MEDILALIGRAHQGDKEARDTLVEKNIGLVHSIVRRFFKPWGGGRGFVPDREHWSFEGHRQIRHFL